MSRPITHTVVSLLLLGGGCAAAAARADAIGPTYEIAEPHLLDFIEQRLQQKERSGELAALQQQIVRRGIASAQTPAAVPHLKATEARRSFFFDPSFTLERNLLDSEGRLLFAAGTRKNPLEVVSMTGKLLFFDARDARQASFAHRLIQSSDKPIKPILTGGAYAPLMQQWRVPVYFDQQGSLVRRFGIRQVPALVSQDGLLLRIDELEITP